MTALLLLTGASHAADLYFVHTDQLGTPRLIADSGGQAVWQWLNDDPFGNNVPNEDPSGLGNFTYNERAPGQYFDKETNLHYNYFRDYDPAIGRYMQSDLIGLAAGTNTYAYVGSSPLSFSDLFGLFKVIERGFPKEEEVLRGLGQRLQTRIKELCPEARAKLQMWFDQWIVGVDPNLNQLKRNRTTYATTDPVNPITTFNSRFFALHPYLNQGGEPSQGNTFRHEFRHIMPENKGLSGSNDVREQLFGNAAALAIEQDANDFMRRLIVENCPCLAPFGRR